MMRSRLERNWDSRAATLLSKPTAGCFPLLGLCPCKLVITVFRWPVSNVSPDTVCSRFETLMDDGLKLLKQLYDCGVRHISQKGV